jgi:hypothetical protein
MPEYAELIQLYTQGDKQAIAVVDTALAVAIDLAYMRDTDQRLYDLEDEHEINYTDQRQDMDEAIDTRLPAMQVLGLKPSFKYACESCEDKPRTEQNGRLCESCRDEWKESEDR